MVANITVLGLSIKRDWIPHRGSLACLSKPVHKQWKPMLPLSISTLWYTDQEGVQELITLLCKNMISLQEFDWIMNEEPNLLYKDLIRLLNQKITRKSR